MSLVHISSRLAVIAKRAELITPHPSTVPVRASALHEFALYILSKETSAVCQPNFAQVRASLPAVLRSPMVVAYIDTI